MLVKNSKKRAEITLIEAVGLVLAGALILIIFTPIGNFVKDFIVEQSPSENALQLLGENINNLIVSPDKFKQIRAVPITIEAGYSIIGFDDEYESVSFTDFIADSDALHHYPEIISLIGNEGIKEIKKPAQCGTSGCLCLIHKKNGIIDCSVYTEKNLIFAGIPFQDPDNSAWSSVISYFSVLFKDKQRDDLPMQNMGAGRDTKNIGFKDDLISFGLNQELLSYYGYLFLGNKAYYHQFASSPIKWDVRSVYIEKMKIGGYTFILLIPADSNYNSEDGYNLAGEIIKKRVEVYNQVISGYDQMLISSIKEKNDSKDYLGLFEGCKEYGKEFPSKRLPGECENIGLCQQSMANSDVKCYVEDVPCVCMNKKTNEVCETEDSFCYLNSGCSENMVDTEFECGWD